MVNKERLVEALRASVKWHGPNLLSVNGALLALWAVEKSRSLSTPSMKE
jgi:hypothetical protein